MNQIMTCSAVGDMILQRMLPDGKDGYDGFVPVRDFINRAQFRFANLETTVHQFECPPAESGGGDFLCAPPKVLNVVKAFGFNALSTANNHALDYCHEGTVKTLEYLDAAGLAHAGSGRNLAEAAAPTYLDLPSGRVAFIGVGTVYRDPEMAGSQTRNLKGRPGINGLHRSAEYYITPEQMRVLKEIAEGTAINGEKDIARKEGFAAPLREGEFPFGLLSFFEAEKPGRKTKCSPLDLARITDMIDEAKYLSDYVVISLHAHDIAGTEKENPDDYIREFAHTCIDAGADAIIGHGPHLLRPLEIYNGKPIFYSLGNFILMEYNQTRYPAQHYEKYHLNPAENVHKLMMASSYNETKGLLADERMLKAVIPYWEWKDGKLTKLELMPIELGFSLPVYQAGWPHFAPDKGILERLAELSEPCGTRIEIRDGIGTVILS